jgi:hypothetical protein
VYQHGNLPDRARAVAGFALAAAMERGERYAEAYCVLVEANALKRKEVQWEPDFFSQIIDKTIRTFSEPIARAADPQLGREVIFVISLPRSASTLTEQILASHPQVTGADELQYLPNILLQESTRRGLDFHLWAPQATAADWERLGRSYMQQTKPWQSRSRFTDKGLITWQLVGAARAMLPGAKFVNCRRDPIETIWSCFKQLFPVGQPFAYDIHELVAFWRDYDRLMRFWHERHPGLIYENVYEDLIANPESQIRGMLDYCGLSFDSSCLSFHETHRLVRTPSSAQVRQPLRNDTARAQRYGALLDPIRKALRAAVAG